MKNLTQQELEQVISYQTKSLDYMKKLLFDQIEKDKLEERKCHFCGQPADRDALDEDGNSIEICENCDQKKENL